MENILLPSGFYDVLASKARQKTTIIHNILDYILSNNYDLIDPPLVEFEESFFANNFINLDSDTYRVMDPISHKMMVLRSDITVQIARIAMMRYNKKPLRYAYSGEVLRVKNNLIHGNRQQNQTGLELIGEDSIEADLEIIKIMINSLKKLKIKDIHLDLSIPNLTALAIKELKIKDKNLQTELSEAICRKDYSKAVKLYPKIENSLLARFLDFNFELDQVNLASLPDEIAALCKRLIELKKLIAQQFPELKISVDLLDFKKFNYHEKLGFLVFAADAKIEIARGGRYNIYDKAKKLNIAATGGTFCVHEMLEVLKSN